jgi:hypothetical protein
VALLVGVGLEEVPDGAALDRRIAHLLLADPDPAAPAAAAVVGVLVGVVVGFRNLVEQALPLLPDLLPLVSRFLQLVVLEPIR